VCDWYTVAARTGLNNNAITTWRITAPAITSGESSTSINWENLHFQHGDLSNFRKYVCLASDDLSYAYTRGVQSKCLFQTAPPRTALVSLGPQWLLFVTKTKEINQRMEICLRWGCYLHGKWLAEDQDQKFFYSGIRALEPPTSSMYYVDPIGLVPYYPTPGTDVWGV